MDKTTVCVFSHLNLNHFDPEYVARRANNIVHTPPLHYPEIGKQGLGSFIYESCVKHANKIFQIDSKTGQSETYSTVRMKSVRVALEMRKIGIKEGDVISICSTNNMNTVIPVFASTFLNVVVASLDPSLSVRDSVYLLQMIRPKLIFVEPSALKLVENICQQLNYNLGIVVMGPCDNYLPFSQFLKEKDNENEFEPIEVTDVNDLAVMLFSSGTTGMPKAIKCSHYGLLYGMYGMRQMDMCGKASLQISSFYWISAYITTLLTIVYGGYKVNANVNDPTLIMNSVDKYKITFAFLSTNTAYHLTKENTAGYDTSSVQNIVFSGSSLSVEHLSRCKSYFPNALVSAGYGQSEASNFISIFSKSSTPILSERYPGSCGVPLPGISVKIVDPDTEEILQPHQQGEIRIHSRGVFLGYYNEDVSNAFDSDGYLKTGDVGYFNEDNCLYVCDRLKDMFKYQCWHIVPASVEKIIYQHPAVKEAVVIGIPHPEDGDHPMALVVLKEEHSNVNEEDIETFVNSRVLDRERLRAGVRFIPAFPKTVTGKIVRRLIRKAAIEGTL